MHTSHQHRKLTDVPKPQHPPNHTLVRSEPNLLIFISSVMTPELNWARKEAVRAVNGFRCAQPWAFEFTPASSECATDAYLRKAREADFLVWLVGSQTTQPVVDEVTARMAAGRRLLLFKLPAESRDAPTGKLLAMVSKHCKWQDVSTGTALGEALTASLSDEIRRALRDPAAPARRQTLRQWRDSSLAKCKQLWITLGVPSALATELANDRSVGDVLTPTDVHFQMAVAAAGSGKSLGASRFFQRAIDAALKDGTQPFPLFVNARDLTDPLEEYIERRTAGLVQPHSQPTLVIVDGLDERGVSQANELLTQIGYYVDAYPESRFLATSRPLPGLRLPDPHTTLPALCDHETIDLISRIAGRTVQLVELYGWSESVRNAAQRPLFAGMIGAELRQGRSMGLDRPADLINRLARHVVEQNRQQGERLNRLLQKLAVKAISTGRRVRGSDVSHSHVDQRLLENSGLIDESGVTFGFQPRGAAGMVRSESSHRRERLYRRSRSRIRPLDDSFPTRSRIRERQRPRHVTLHTGPIGSRLGSPFYTRHYQRRQRRRGYSQSPRIYRAGGVETLECDGRGAPRSGCPVLRNRSGCCQRQDEYIGYPHGFHKGYHFLV